MNKVILTGRLTADPVIRHSQQGMCVANYTLAVDRRTKDKGADFIPCIAFDKKGEFAEKYLKKGTKIAIVGHIQTGSYTNREGKKVYTTDVIIEEQEFAESKSAHGSNSNDAIPPKSPEVDADGFMDADLSDLPF